MTLNRIHTALALLSSMIMSGEPHSPLSLKIISEAKLAIKELNKKLSKIL